MIPTPLNFYNGETATVGDYKVSMARLSLGDQDALVNEGGRYHYTWTVHVSVTDPTGTVHGPVPFQTDLWFWPQSSGGLQFSASSVQSNLVDFGNGITLSNLALDNFSGPVPASFYAVLNTPEQPPAQPAPVETPPPPTDVAPPANLPPVPGLNDPVPIVVEPAPLAAVATTQASWNSPDSGIAPRNRGTPVEATGAAPTTTPQQIPTWVLIAGGIGVLWLVTR